MELSKLMGCIKRPFTPSELFRGGLIDGAWFDPSDLSTLYQDAAGTIPVTAVGRPVGLMLDKSRGMMLGPELVSNGTFDSGTEGWVSSVGYPATITATGGICSFTSAAPSARIRPPVITTNIGAMYTVTITILSLATTVIVRPSIESSQGVGGTSLGDFIINSVGTYTFMFKARTTTTYLWVLNNGAIGTVVSLDNISVRELYGYHATQSITASRPTLSARYNLLTKTEDFSAAAWVVSGCSAVKNYGVSPIGTITSSLLTNSAVGGYLTQADGVVGANKTLTAYIKNSSTGWVRIAIASLAVGKNGAGYFINTTTGAKGSVFTGGTGYSVVSCASEMQADGWVKVVLTVAGAREVQQPVLNIAQSDGNFSGPIGATVQLWGVDQRLGTTSGPYQRVNTATDYDTDERYFKKYLRFDGVDDYLNLPYMGLYAGGSASVVAAITVSPSTWSTILAEGGGGNDGLYILARYTGTNKLGTFIQDDNRNGLLGIETPITQGITTVLSVVDAGSAVTHWVSSRLAGSSNYTRSGPLTNAVTLVGARPYSDTLNGNLYSLIITKSALTDAQRIKCERYAASKAGVIL